MTLALIESPGPPSLRGAWLALALHACWSLTLCGLLLGPAPGRLPAVAVALLVLLRTFLQTGLFITAHDAMHRSLMPRHRGLNDGIGRLSLVLYGFLPYGACRRNHVLHHQRPGAATDPDFHDGIRPHPVHWYVKFMRGYLSIGQILALLGCWAGIALVLHPFTGSILPKILLFWSIPLMLSSIQLFLFGTYLPHRGRAMPASGEHQVKSLAMPPLLSLLSCYHFGYHREHHECPWVPWYALPSLHAAAGSRPEGCRG